MINSMKLVVNGKHCKKMAVRKAIFSFKKQIYFKMPLNRIANAITRR